MIGGPSDHLLQISRQQGAIEAVVQVILLLFYASLNVALSISALCQCIPHQACVYDPLPEVQLAVDSLPDIPGLVGAQCLSKDHMGK